MKKPALPLLEARSLAKKIRANGLHCERLSSYIKVVNYSLTKYATDEIILHTFKELEPNRQGSGMSAALYAKRSYKKALHCGTVYEEGAPSHCSAND